MVVFKMLIFEMVVFKMDVFKVVAFTLIVFKMVVFKMIVFKVVVFMMIFFMMVVFRMVVFKMVVFKMIVFKMVVFNVVVFMMVVFKMVVFKMVVFKMVSLWWLSLRWFQIEIGENIRCGIHFCCGHFSIFHVVVFLVLSYTPTLIALPMQTVCVGMGVLKRWHHHVWIRALEFSVEAQRMKGSWNSGWKNRWMSEVCAGKVSAVAQSGLLMLAEIATVLRWIRPPSLVADTIGFKALVSRSAHKRTLVVFHLLGALLGRFSSCPLLSCFCHSGIRKRPRPNGTRSIKASVCWWRGSRLSQRMWSRSRNRSRRSKTISLSGRGRSSEWKVAVVVI